MVMLQYQALTLGGKEKRKTEQRKALEKADE